MTWSLSKWKHISISIKFSNEFSRVFTSYSLIHCVSSGVLIETQRYYLSMKKKKRDKFLFYFIEKKWYLGKA